MRYVLLFVFVASLHASDLASFVEIYQQDLGALERRYDLGPSPERIERMRAFFQQSDQQLNTADFDALDQAGKLDWVLMSETLATQARLLAEYEARLDEVAPMLPFAGELAGLHEARRRMEEIDARGTATQLTALLEQVDEARKAAEDLEVAKAVAHRAHRTLEELREALKQWYEFHAGYDPLFTWWNLKPYEALAKKLEEYQTYLREEKAGAKDPDAIIGDPIGRAPLLADLRSERIPYTPEELIEIAEKEFAWCDREMLRASREMGFGDDWHAAMEKVKTLHVEPGEQPALIRRLAVEAIDFLETRKLLTIPRLAKETWRMSMMSPERQKVSPFFLGGEEIIVSFPTEQMDHADKLMSLRGNNIHFSRATVHHELIPGHHLQQFMTRRYQPHRRLFDTPFWTEGWSLYWEMRLWDLDFTKTPEDRVGFLFWRMHRCARIIFSLKFHLGEMTPEEAIDFLVDRVGHERANAEAEVRRSFLGTSPPLYQCAYMLGALQFRDLYREAVVEGGMGEAEFHDAILRLGRIPVDLVRTAITGQEIRREMPVEWRFYPGID